MRWLSSRQNTKQKFTYCSILQNVYKDMQRFYLTRSIDQKIFQKMQLIMKLSFVLFFIGTFCIYANTGYAQDTRVNLHLEQASLTDVFREIEKQSDFRFFYNNTVVSTSKKIDLDTDNESISALLIDLFHGTDIHYRMVENYIVVTNKHDQLDEILSNLSAVQGITITGTVTDNGDPLPGVNVTIKGTTIGVVTDANGKYSIMAPNKTAVLVFSFVGYITDELVVGDQTVVDIALNEDAREIEEVVVIGYGTVKKSDLTGAVSVVNTKNMGEIPSASVLESMSGHIAGVDITMNARPGDTGFALVRGVSNFTNNTPLYVIDGMPTSNIRDFNPNDIESIQVLKDASAAAIYGSRAANGVIIITTKHGSAGPLKINFSANYTIQHFAKPVEMAGSEEWAVLSSASRVTAGLAPIPPGERDLTHDTDWLDALIRPGSLQHYTLSLSGGTPTGRYYVSGEYYNNKGVLYGSGYERYTVRVNTSGQKGIFSYGQTFNVSNNEVDPLQGDIFNALSMAPVVPVKDPNNPGGYGYGGNKNINMGENPIARNDLIDTYNTNLRMQGVLWAELAIWKKRLKYKLNLGYELNFTNSKTLRKEGNWRMNLAYEPSYVNQSSGRADRPLVEHTLTYDQTFGKHVINALIGHSFSADYNNHSISGRISDINRTSDDVYLPVLDAGNSSPIVGGSIDRAALLSYLGRLSYNYDNKYLFTATIRRDGTSRVQKEARWGNFPSVSAAWRITQEPFMNVSWLDDLKIRASYGTLGSMNIGSWDYLATINTYLTMIMGTSQTPNQAAIATRLVNSDIKWETQTQFNIGFDAAFLKNRLAASVDYYISNTNDVLTSMPILMTTGNFGGSPVVNAASIENKGVELSLSWRDRISRDLYYNIGLNVTTTRNKVTDLGYGREYITSGNGKTEIGRPIGDLYIRKYLGVFQSQEEIDNYTWTDPVTGVTNKIIPNASPGDTKFADMNNDGKINDSDKLYLGSPHPLFGMGLNIGMTWKNFDFRMNWYGDFGYEIFNDFKRFLVSGDGVGNADGGYMKGQKWWTPEDPVNIPIPRAGNDRNRLASDYWMENGSWAKLRTLTVGYTIPGVLLKKINVESCRVFFTGYNLLTFTKVSYVDPEYRRDNIWDRGTRGVGAYPNPMSFNFGLQLQF